MSLTAVHAGLALPQTAGQLHALGTSHDKSDLTIDELAMAGFGGSVAALAGYGTGITTLAHETGHAVTASLVYQNANPHISITPFKGGVTTFDPATPSALGHSLGPAVSTALVSAAGVTVDALTSMTAFAAGYHMRKQHRILGPTLMGYAGFVMLNDTLYAASALSGPLATLAAHGNDFAGLAAALHISPLIAVGVFASLLPLEYLALRELEKHSS